MATELKRMTRRLFNIAELLAEDVWDRFPGVNFVNIFFTDKFFYLSVSRVSLVLEFDREN